MPQIWELDAADLLGLVVRALLGTGEPLRLFILFCGRWIKSSGDVQTRRDQFAMHVLFFEGKDASCWVWIC